MLSLLSYNISLSHPSHRAPSHWKEEDGTEQRQALRDILIAQNVDVLALQEVPDPKWPLLIFPITSYIPLGTVPSHSGYTALLIRTVHAQKVQNVYQIGSCILAILDFPDHSLAIAACHLAPSPQNHALRKEQLHAIIQFCEQKSIERWILIGDMNMRKSENESIEHLPQHSTLSDAWKQCGNPKNRWTWDSYTNLYHPPPQYSFRARFDRVYSWPASWNALSFARFADQPIQNSKHFLSDHFGIRVSFPKNLK